MREITSAAGLENGDVVMVKRPYVVKGATPPKTVQWRFFGIVTKVHKYRVMVYRIGARNDTEATMSVSVSDPHTTVWLLEPDEWPDGVLVTRTKLVLLGEIEF